jgi:hypothetical protein
MPRDETGLLIYLDVSGMGQAGARLARGRKWLVVAVTLAVVGVGFWALRKPAGYAGQRPYFAAFVTGATLVVFPFNAPKVNVPLQFAPGRSAYSPDGRSLYADRQYPGVRPGLFRIDLKSGQETAVPGSSGLFAYSLAISHDEGKIVISGEQRKAERMECGIFELETVTGTVRTVPVSTKPDCDHRYSWHDLSLSPDAKR